MRFYLAMISTLCLVIMTAGCSRDFELTKATRLDRQTSGMTTAMGLNLGMAQDKLAKELTERTGWEWQAQATIFQDGKTPKNTIYLALSPGMKGDGFVVEVTAKSVRIEAGTSKGFDKAIDALLAALVQKDGRFFLPVGTIKPS
jgi:hypothetical protein